MSTSKGYIHSLESFGSVDGPGVRYVIFLQGCNLRCKFCHNPDTWKREGGQEWTPADLFKKVYQYRHYWGKKGGITVSGGEPLLQMEFVTEFFRLAKEKKVHTTLDTSGGPFTMKEPFLPAFDELMKYTDLFMVDLKEWDAKKHKKLTGQSNENILAMTDYLSDHGKEMWIRHVLVPGVTDGKNDLRQMGAYIQKFNTVTRVECLPYHTLGKFKWDNLGLSYPLADTPVPTKEEVKKAQTLLCPKNPGVL
ncbi:MAG: pyruvate formate-lyase-activating protein [Lachnospiraceae bacterium]|nr:pyruvate formate-lyase-activating protein [Lachnospiraceae bacterium]